MCTFYLSCTVANLEPKQSCILKLKPKNLTQDRCCVSCIAINLHINSYKIVSKIPIHNKFSFEKDVLSCYYMLHESINSGISTEDKINDHNTTYLLQVGRHLENRACNVLWEIHIKSYSSKIKCILILIHTQKANMYFFIVY